MAQFQDKKFQRRKEAFRCGHCDTEVEGNGYTNHCPECLYSKHVDIFPGDRAAVCGGMMEPAALSHEGKNDKITHRCVRCGYEKKNKVTGNDDFEALLTLSRRLANR